MTYNHKYFEWETVYMIFFFSWDVMVGFPGSSGDKEPTCNAGDPGSLLGLGSSPGEGIGYPLQYSWASLMAQMVTNLPAVLETWVWFQGWEDSLKEHMAIHSSILAWRTSMSRGAWWATVHGVTKNLTWLTKHTYTHTHTMVTWIVFFETIWTVT